MISRIIELYENERYIVGVGFSTKNLLPSDRNRFSLKDGTSSFATLEDAEKGLISHGWIWETKVNELSEFEENEEQKLNKEWTFIDIDKEKEKENNVITSDFWVYAIDFRSIDDSYSNTKLLTSFVRRRALIRNQSFILPLLLQKELCFLRNIENNNREENEKFSIILCENCDTKKISHLSNILLVSISELSIIKHPRQFNCVKLNILKNQLLKVLRLNSNSSDNFNIDNIESELNLFSTSEQQDLITSASSFFSKGDNYNNLSNRKDEILSNFTIKERNELSKLIIKKHDRNFEFHCSLCINKDEHDLLCEFSPIECPNKGCKSIFSRKYSFEHDEICDYKIVDCKCGEKICRFKMEFHLDESCELRSCACLYSDLGCSKELTYRTLQEHLDTQQQNHLLLAINRVREQQHVIVDLHQRLLKIEDNSNSQVKTVDSGLTYLHKLLKEREYSHLELVDEFSKNKSVVENRLNTLASETQAEVKSVKRSIAEIKSNHQK